MASRNNKIGESPNLAPPLLFPGGAIDEPEFEYDDLEVDDQFGDALFGAGSRFSLLPPDPH